MQVTETSAEGLRRQYKIVIPAAEVEERIDEQLETLRRDMRLPGFRPGKVPAALVRKRYGADIRREVVQEAVSKTADQLLDEKGLRTATTPDIEIDSLDEGQDVAFTLSLEVMPEIEIGDLSALRVEREVPIVADALVDDTVQRLAESNKSFVPQPEDHAAETGEFVKVKLSATADGESVSGIGGDGEHLPVGTETMEIVPELQTQLIGLRAGDRRTITATIPDTFPKEDLRGKTLDFDIEVLSVDKQEMPVADDEFAKSLGFESLAALRRTCRERLEKQYRDLARLRAKRRLLDRLADTYQFPVPEGLLEGEFAGIWERVAQAREAGSLSEEDKQKSEAELQAEYRSIAERRVRLGLWLAEVGNSNGIEVSSEELRQAMIREAQKYPGQETLVLRFFKDKPEVIQSLRAPLFEEKVVDFVLEMADVVDEEVDAEELRKRSEATDA